MAIRWSKLSRDNNRFKAIVSLIDKRSSISEHIVISCLSSGYVVFRSYKILDYDHENLKQWQYSLIL